jgi:hypothetical protein
LLSVVLAVDSAINKSGLFYAFLIAINTGRQTQIKYG